jgi:hypothetical protein
LAKFRYIGAECVYPNILVPEGGSLVAHPGDVREFDTPPDRTWWIKVAETDSKPDPKAQLSVKEVK